MGSCVIFKAVFSLCTFKICKINMETEVFHKLDVRGSERVTCDGLLIYFVQIKGINRISTFIFFKKRKLVFKLAPGLLLFLKLFSNL